MIPNRLIPATAGLGAAVGGLGVGSATGMLSQLSNALSAPRRWTWNALGLPDTGSELVENTLGLDKEGLPATVLGTLAEMVGDPLTVLPGILGARLGSRVGGAAENVAKLAQTRSALADDLSAVNRAGKLAQTGLRDAGLYDDLAAAAAEKARPVNLPSHAQVSYRPEITAEFPDVPRPRVYKRVDPSVMAMANDAGVGSALPGGGLQLVGKPSFAKGSGGVMKPMGDVGSLPGGYLDTLIGPGAQDTGIGLGEIPGRAATMSRPEDLNLGSLLPRTRGGLEASDASDLARALGGADLTPEAAMQKLGGGEVMPGRVGLHRGAQLKAQLADLLGNFRAKADPIERWLLERNYGR